MNNKCILEIETLLGKHIKKINSVAGGDINLTFKVELSDHRTVCVKTQSSPDPLMFLREAEGLALLHETQSLRIPNVLAVSERLIILEWIEISQQVPDFDEKFGLGLAKLHQKSLPAFGLAKNNFLGTLAQINTPLPTWHEFYREHRILPLALQAYQQNIIDILLFKRLSRLCECLDRLCGPPEPVALLHGDLWSGNILCDETGSPVLIDPAVYGGHREVDLAMLFLFDAPVASTRFFACYEEVYPLDSAFTERISLYQLYPLLAHVCMFGQAYIPPLIAALEKYE